MGVGGGGHAAPEPRAVAGAEGCARPRAPPPASPPGKGWGGDRGEVRRRGRASLPSGLTRTAFVRSKLRAAISADAVRGKSYSWGRFQKRAGLDLVAAPLEKNLGPRRSGV